MPAEHAAAGDAHKLKATMDQRASHEMTAANEDLQAQRAALSAAQRQDEIALESIQKQEAEVTKRIIQRANLLQTLQTKGEHDGGQAQTPSTQTRPLVATLAEA